MNPQIHYQIHKPILGLRFLLFRGFMETIYHSLFISLFYYILIFYIKILITKFNMVLILYLIYNSALKLRLYSKPNSNMD